MPQFRFALRQLAKHFGATAVSVLTLGLVIGVLGTLFAGINATFWQPLPINNPDAIVKLSRANKDDQEGHFRNGRLFAEYESQSTALEGIAGIDHENVTLTQHHEPDHMSTAYVSPNLFELLGTPMLLGQPFVSSLPFESQAQTVVLNYWCWEHDFASDPNIVGKVIHLNNQAHTVIGVLPEDFARVPLAYGVELFLPREFSRDHAQSTIYTTIARLKEGVSLQQARTELQTIGTAIEDELAPEQGFAWATASPYFSASMDGEEVALLVFFILIVLFVLLIACGNLTNLLLARSLSRIPELATRLSLGATRGNLVIQLLVEFATLGVLGGLTGVLLASWTTSLLKTHHMNLYFDWRVVAFITVTGLLSGLLAGLAPIIKFTHPNLASALKDASHQTGLNRGQHRLRNGLVVAQIAMVLVLLICSGLMMKSIHNLKSESPGYDTNRLAYVSAYLKDQEHPTLADRQRYARQVMDQLRNSPGIDDVAVSTMAPTVRYAGRHTTWIPTDDDGSAHRKVLVAHNAVGGSFFSMVNAEVLRGRTLDSHKYQSDAAFAVINETFRRRFFANLDPIGQSIEISGDGAARTSFEIIGVIADLKNISYRHHEFPELFVPISRSPSLYGAHFAVKTAGEPATMLKRIRELVRQVNPKQPLHEARLFSHFIARLINLNQEVRLLIVFLATLGFVLSMIGLYGVISYIVNERQRDIGIRVALGASRRRIILSVLSEGTRLVLMGATIGLILTSTMAWILTELMYEVSAWDPQTYLCVLGLVCLTTLVACVVPSRRALNVNPVQALRA